LLSNILFKARIPVLSKSPDAEFISHARKIDPWPINILSFEIIHSFLTCKTEHKWGEESNASLFYLGHNSLGFFFQHCDLCCVTLSSVTSTNKHRFTSGTEGLPAQPALL